MPKKTQAALARQEYREELFIASQYLHVLQYDLEELDLEDDYYYQD